MTKTDQTFNCGECGRRFTSKNPNAKYCSIPCRDRFYYARKKHAKYGKVLEYFGGKLECVRCGYTKDELGYFDLHHRDRSEKEKGAITLLLNRSWKIALAELEKCDLLCPRCHREVHMEQSGRSNR